jgi:hypothetical protein
MDQSINRVQAIVDQTIKDSKRQGGAETLLKVLEVLRKHDVVVSPQAKLAILLCADY